MMFCRNCGRQLLDDSRFCDSCGTPILKHEREENTDRKTVFEGEIHKCPNCGEVLNSFISHCPTCGHEIRSVKAKSAVNELAMKLEKIEAKKMPDIQSEKSVMKTVFGKDFSETDAAAEARYYFRRQQKKEKVNLIVNFVVPNTKEDILEFMILASSNIDVKKGLDDDISKAWLTKLEQVYQKAILLIHNESDLEQIKLIYGNKMNEIIEKKENKIFKTVGGVLLWFLLAGVAWCSPLLIICVIFVGMICLALWKRRKTFRNITNKILK